MKLPRLHDLVPEETDPAILPGELDDAIDRGEWIATTLWPTKRVESHPAQGWASFSITMSLVAGALATIALTVTAILAILPHSTVSYNVTSSAPDGPLVLGIVGRNIVDCVTDELIVFITQDIESTPPSIRLHAGTQSATNVLRRVQGGYFAAFTVKRGVIDVAGTKLQLDPNAELTARVDGYPDPELISVHGRRDAGLDGGERTCDPKQRHLPLP